MKKRFLTLIFTLIVMLMCVCGLSACGECEHEWGEWSVSAHSTCMSQGTKQRKCSKCEEIQTDFLDIGEHLYDAENIVWTWNGYESATATLSCVTDSTHTKQINANVTDEVTTEPTCIETGTKTYTATVKIDGVTYTATKNETLAALGHTEVTDAAVAATCEKTGLTEGSHCSVCKEILVAQKEVSANGHNYDIENIVWTWNGYESATATVSCITDSTHTRQINANITDEITTAATCTETGVKTYTATIVIDGEEYKNTKTDSVESNGHSWNDGEVTAPASAIADGELTYTCLFCPQTKTETFSYPISREDWNRAFGTLFASDNITANLLSIGDDITTNVIYYLDGTKMQGVLVEENGNNEIYYAREHDVDYRYGFYDGEWEKIALEDEITYSVRSVVVQDMIWDEIIGRYSSFVYVNKTDKFIAPNLTITVTDEEIIWYISSIALTMDDGIINSLEFVIIDEDNYTENVCIVFNGLGTTEVTLPHIHVWSDWREETTVSCTNDGLNIRSCATCGETQEEIVYSEGHNYEPTVVSPTCEAQGYTTHTCSTCGDSYIDSYKSALGHAWGSWKANAVSTKTIRDCTNNCGEHQEIISVTAECIGDYYRLIGENVSSDDIVLYALINDEESSIIEIDDFTLENTAMALDGENKVIVKYYTMTTIASVVAIHDNLPNTTSSTEFTWYFDEGNNCYNLTGYSGSSTEIVIPAHISRIPVRVINERVFRYNSNIVSVTIPPSIQTIGDRAFEGCTALKTLTLNEGLKSIGYYAFSGCPIVTLSIPDTVKTVGNGVFNGCTKLTTVVIGDGLNGISYEMFRGCSALKSITIGDAVETIGEYALYDCVSLEEVVFGESVISIYSYAFRYCSSLASINIPSNVQTIGDRAFDGCTALKTLTLNEGLKSIGSYAFSGCPIVTLSIPDTVKTVESGVFNGCTKLTTVVIGDGLNGISYEMFRGCSALKSITIGDAVETIGESALYDCVSLEEVVFGESVIAIYNYAFRYCSSLASINIPSSVQSIGSRAFEGCTALKTLTLNEGLKSIGYYAFSGCPIVTLSIPDTVKTVESGVFSYCKKLESVTIGAGLNNISYEMFRDCSALKTVVVGDGVESIGEYAFAYCSALNNIKLGNGLLAIYNYAFRDCTALTTIVIPNSVQTIGDRAFEGCTLLVNFNIGTGVQRIGAYALQNCSSLKSVAIPTNVQVIGAGLFNNCSSLEEVIIEKGVLREVGNDVFNGCSSFDRMYYTGTASDWVLVAVSEDNSYPLNVSPYYYSFSSPSGKGNYWYYNSNGEIRVWNVSETSFKAEEYSEKFANSTFGSSNTSYSSQFLSQLEGDSLFQARILIWEALHIATDSSWESKAISKKDVYKMVIYDLLVGEADAQVNPLAGMDAACNSYVYDFAKFLLGKDSLTKAELDQLKNLSPLDYDYVEMVDKYFKGIDVLKEVFEMSTNLYDALYVAAQYKALSDMDTNFYLVLTEISNDGSLPWDLRNAASECADCYKTATDALLKKIVVQEFASSTMEVLWKDFQDEAWKAVLGSVFPQVKFADLTIKGAMFLANMGFNLDACNEAYYQLEAAVGLENALRNVIKNTLPDYLRYNYKDKSEYYMYAIDMYQTSVLLGFDYSNNLLREHSKSADVNAEEKQAYENMMAQISGMKQEKATMYNNFESVIEQLYIAYYA